MRAGKPGELTRSFVVDASVFLPLVVIYGRRLRGVLGEFKFHALDLTCYEVCNGLWKEYRKIDREAACTLCKGFKELVKRYAVVHSVLELDAGK